MPRATKVALGALACSTVVQARRYAANAGVNNYTKGDVHSVFTVDCRPFNLWQTELLFYSAQRAGQEGPVTGIVSGCSEKKKAAVMQRHQDLEWPAQFTLHFVDKFNDKKSMWMSKPFGLRSWFRAAGPERAILAVMDPDFVFLKPLTAELTGRNTAMHWEGELPTHVKKGVVVAQRYALANPDPNDKELFTLRLQKDGKEDPSLLSYVCSGSMTGETGCNNMTRAEVSLYHSVGVPYLAHKDDWDWLVDGWADTMGRLHEHYVGDQLYADMWAWSLANMHKRQRQLVLHDYIVTTPDGSQADWEAWKGVDETKLDSCENPLDSVLTKETSGKMAHFIHYCGPLDTFTKYWFDWGAEDGPNAFERCDDTGTEGLNKIMAKVPNMTVEEMAQKKDSKFHTLPEQHRARFLGCTMRSFFKQALRKSCGDKPGGVFVAKGPM